MIVGFHVIGTFGTKKGQKTTLFDLCMIMNLYCYALTF